MSNVPLTVWLGGMKASVSYQGRSGCCVGEDQIVFTVPANAPLGCAVPLVVQIGTTANTISNSTVIPIASGSRNCTPTNPALASVNVEQGVMAGPISFGSLELDKFANDNAPGLHDQVQLLFAKVPSYAPGSQPFFASYIDDQPLGTCLVQDNPNVPGADSYLFGNLVTLDAGSSFTVKGPNGSMNVAGTPGQTRATLSAAGTFLVPGDYTISGTGGKDIGPFSATITIPSVPTFTVPQGPVNRANGLTVTWKGGDPNGHVEMVMFSAIDNTFNVGALAYCKASSNAGTFTIPSYVLLALPAGNFTQFALGPGTVQGAAERGFTATGIDIGLIQTYLDGNAIGGFPLN
jgi:hypothetical protein